MFWTFIAPRHKTKSGEVPTPTQVLQALAINNTLDERENEKQSDFELTGEARDARISELQQQAIEKEAQVVALNAQLVETEASAKAEMDAAILPVQKRYDDLKAANKQALASRKDAIKSLSGQVAEKLATKEQLLDLIRQNNRAVESERTEEKVIKEELASLRDDSKKLKQAKLSVSAAANEVQHIKKRIDYLTTGNRDKKVEKALTDATSALASLDESQTQDEIYKAATAVVKGEEKAERYRAQEYPRAATIWYQTRRSLFTVFVGFVMAAVVAIPVGIMCGLSPIIMACLTPIISIFKPVSPVVWLLIFQIVVGAFFPDPETHPLFVFCSKLPIIGNLDVNPALIFSACTVAMCALWPALVNTALGVSSVDPDHINVAKVLKLGLWSRLTKIIIPSALPLVFAGLRISLGVGWMVLIAAEALSSSNGLGKYVWDEYQNGSSQTFANIIFACFVIGIIGFILDRFMIVLQRSVSFDDGAAVV